MPCGADFRVVQRRIGVVTICGILERRHFADTTPTTSASGFESEGLIKGEPEMRCRK